MPDIELKNKKILVVGGTYLYVRVLTEGLIEGVEPDSNYREQLKTERYLYGNQYIYKQLIRCDPESAKNIAENDYIRLERALEVYHLTGIKMSQLQKQHSFSEKRYEVFKIGIELIILIALSEADLSTAATLTVPSS